MHILQVSRRCSKIAFFVKILWSSTIVTRIFFSEIWVQIYLFWTTRFEYYHNKKLAIWFLTVNVCVPMNLLAWGLRSSALFSFIFHGNLIQYITKLLSRVIDQYLCSLTITIKILSTQAPSGGKTFKITKIRDDLEPKSFSLLLLF